MQPDKASAVMMAIIGNRNTRATRTGAIPHRETAVVLDRLWLKNRFASRCEEPAWQAEQQAFLIRRHA
jgi:hypothetical protein